MPVFHPESARRRQGPQGHRAQEPGGCAVMQTETHRSNFHAGQVPHEMPVWAGVCADRSEGKQQPCRALLKNSDDSTSVVTQRGET
jgi:hypothetical protein